MPEDDKINWGSEIVRIRGEKGMSQRELSELSGVNRSSLRNLERNGEGTIEMLERVAAVLGYEVEMIKL